VQTCGLVPWTVTAVGSVLFAIFRDLRRRPPRQPSAGVTGELSPRKQAGNPEAGPSKTTLSTLTQGSLLNHDVVPPLPGAVPCNSAGSCRRWYTRNSCDPGFCVLACSDQRTTVASHFLVRGRYGAGLAHCAGASPAQCAGCKCARTSCERE
jgi:hypothetical protein